MIHLSWHRGLVAAAVAGLLCGGFMTSTPAAGSAPVTPIHERWNATEVHFTFAGLDPSGCLSSVVDMLVVDGVHVGNGTTTVGGSVFFGGIEQRDVCHGQPQLVVHLLLPASPDFPRNAVWVTGTLSRGRFRMTMPMTDNGTANTVPVTFDLDFVATGPPVTQAGTTHDGPPGVPATTGHGHSIMRSATVTGSVTGPGGTIVDVTSAGWKSASLFRTWEGSKDSELR